MKILEIFFDKMDAMLENDTPPTDSVILLESIHTNYRFSCGQKNELFLVKMFDANCKDNLH